MLPNPSLVLVKTPLADQHQEEQREWEKTETVTLPSCDLDHVIVTGKEIYGMLYTQCANKDVWGTIAQDSREFISQSRSVVNILAKRFEMKKAADAHKRTMTAKTGTLDTVKMMNYKWSEDVFRSILSSVKVRTTVSSCSSTGLVAWLNASAKRWNSLSSLSCSARK